MDAIDRALIRALEFDGRRSHESLARMLNISRQTVAERLGRLLTEGSVEIRGVAHPSLIGVNALGYVVFEIDGPVEVVARELAEDTRVAFVSIVAGPWPLVAEIRAATETALAEAVARARNLSGVRTLHITRYRSLIRDVIGPVGSLGTSVDEVDRRIITQLEHEGRASYIEMAQSVRRSPSSVRQRVLRLVAGHAVRVGAVVRRGGSEAITSVGVGVRLGHGEPLARLMEHGEVFFAARALGHYDLILSLRAYGPLDALHHVEAIRAWPEVRSADIWQHLHVLKENYALPVSSRGLA